VEGYVLRANVQDVFYSYLNGCDCVHFETLS
jgi:hypothetical protein